MSKSIELLLLTTVDNLGLVGDVVKVKAGYARNYLLPMGFATAPSEELIAQLADKRAAAEAELKAQRSTLEELFGKVDGQEITIERATNDSGILFGGISQHDIAEVLRGIEGLEAVEDRQIRTGEKMNRVGTYYVPVQFAKDLKGEIVLKVRSDRELDIDKEVEEVVSEEDELAEQAADALSNA